MLPFFNCLVWFTALQISLFLVSIKKQAAAVKYMQRLLSSAEKRHKKKVLRFNPKDEEKRLFDIIDSALKDCADIFAAGAFSGNYALYSKNKSTKFIYIDNYSLCDEFYCFIVKNNIEGISCAVLQPLLNDENLNDDLKYRALYDNFTLSRFISDAVVFDFDEVYDSKYYTPAEFCSVISQYSKKCIIVKLRKDKILAAKIHDEMRRHYECAECTDTGNSYIIIAESKFSSPQIKDVIYYGNDNRGRDAEKQCRAIIDIIRRNKIH